MADSKLKWEMAFRIFSICVRGVGGGGGERMGVGWLTWAARATSALGLSVLIALILMQ